MIKKKIIAIVFIFFIAISMSLATTEVLDYNDVVSDTSVYKDAATCTTCDNCYDTTDHLVTLEGNADGDYYIRFDTSDVDPWVDITSARLMVNCAEDYGAGSSVTQVYEISNITFTECYVTYNNMPAKGTVLDSTGNTSSDHGYVWTGWDLTPSEVEPWLKNKTISFALSTDSDSTTYLYCKQHEDGATGPKLELIFTDNCQVPDSGDWFLNSVCFIEHATAKVPGNLTIQSGGKLILGDKGILDFTSTGQWINILSGGELIIENGGEIRG
ncbi:MAG: DNRLRE domain-containing protein [Candidatus Asgardarchaeia archaeon]